MVVVYGYACGCSFALSFLFLYGLYGHSMIPFFSLHFHILLFIMPFCSFVHSLSIVFSLFFSSQAFTSFYIAFHLHSPHSRISHCSCHSFHSPLNSTPSIYPFLSSPRSFPPHSHRCQCSFALSPRSCILQFRHTFTRNTDPTLLPLLLPESLSLLIRHFLVIWGNPVCFCPWR